MCACVRAWERSPPGNLALIYNNTTDLSSSKDLQFLNTNNISSCVQKHAQPDAPTHRGQTGANVQSICVWICVSLGLSAGISIDHLTSRWRVTDKDQTKPGCVCVSNSRFLRCLEKSGIGLRVFFFFYILRHQWSLFIGSLMKREDRKRGLAYSTIEACYIKDITERDEFRRKIENGKILVYFEIIPCFFI